VAVPDVLADASLLTLLLIVLDMILAVRQRSTSPLWDEWFYSIVRAGSIGACQVLLWHNRHYCGSSDSIVFFGALAVPLVILAAQLFKFALRYANS